MNKKNLEEIIRRLREMRLPEMANQLILMNETGELHTISAEALIQRLTQEELLSRKNNTVERYRKMAKLSQPAAELSDIEYKPERKIKCPQCGYFLCKAYGTEHCCISVLCNKCKFKEVIDLALFRTMRLKQIYNEKEGYWYVPTHGEIPA